MPGFEMGFDSENPDLVITSVLTAFEKSVASQMPNTQSFTIF
jgi:hypothetical protein